MSEDIVHVISGVEIYQKDPVDWNSQKSVPTSIPY